MLRTSIFVVVLGFIDTLLGLKCETNRRGQFSSHFSKPAIVRFKRQSQRGQLGLGEVLPTIVAMHQGPFGKTVFRRAPATTRAREGTESAKQTYLANGGEDEGLSSVVTISTNTKVQFERGRVRSELDVDTKDRIGRAHGDLGPKALVASLRALGDHRSSSIRILRLNAIGRLGD